MSLGPGAEALVGLEASVDTALTTRDESRLRVLGYGEISMVVQVDGDAGSFACKRLPLFDDPAELAAYRETYFAYLEALAAAGLRVLPSDLGVVQRADGRTAAYCVQEMVPGSALLPAFLAECDEAAAERVFTLLVDAVFAVVSECLGLDGQASNWVVQDDGLAYLDISTPMLRDEHGVDRLNTDLFLSSLPWLLRGLAKWLFLSSILDKYYDPRGVLLDLAGNLHKEKATRWLPILLRLANERLEEPLGEREIWKYYVEDARMWSLLQRLRRLDRFLHRLIGRTYPFLLPRKIERQL